MTCTLAPPVKIKQLVPGRNRQVFNDTLTDKNYGIFSREAKAVPFHFLSVPTGDTQNTRDLGTGVWYPRDQCDTGIRFPGPDMREETGASVFLPSALAIFNMAGQVKSKRERCS